MSLQIAKVKEIPIKLHFTLIIVFFLVAWTLSVGFMPSFFPNLSTTHYWIMGIAGAIILFISVLLHELAHSLLSLKYGLKVRQIILFIFGGVSDIKEETKDYGKEFKIAVVGPLTSFALASGFALVWFILLQVGGSAAFPAIPNSQNDGNTDGEISGINPNGETITDARNINDNSDSSFLFIRTLSGILLYSIIVNALVGAFNLLPAFPLDGGRMLRAGLVKWKKSFDEATRIAVKVGIGISYGLMAFGFITIFRGSFVGGFWLILIGWFLQSGAQSYLQQSELSSVLSHVRLKDIMNKQFASVRVSQTVAEILSNYFNKYRKSEFPVLDGEGNLVGSISTRQIMNIDQEKVENTKVEDIMIPSKDLIVMSPDRKADEALKRLLNENKSRIFVCDDGFNIDNRKAISRPTETIDTAAAVPGQQNILSNKRRLAGIISKTDILNVAAERQEYEKTVKDLVKG